jgi:putative ABC transport system permease protein
MIENADLMGKSEESHGTHWLDQFTQDLRFGMRWLVRKPGFAAVGVVTLALGIGANTTILNLANAVLLRPLPFRDPDRLVLVSETKLDLEKSRFEVAWPQFEDWRRQSGSFENMAAFSGTSASWQRQEGQIALNGQRVSADFFAVLKANPQLGRPFLPDEFVPGRSTVAVISYGFWQDYWGGNSNVLGQALEIGGRSLTIIGVMPPGFRFPYNTQVWLPMVPDARESEHRDVRSVRVVGRLRPRTTLQEAQTEMEVIAGRIAQEHPDSNQEWGALVEPLRVIWVGGDLRDQLLIVGAAALFVLLAACANVANLLLVRHTERQTEMSIRLALGAGRRRIARQLLTEGFLVAILGTVAGLLLAYWISDAAATLVPESVLGGVAPAPDVRILVLTLFTVLATGFTFGLVPILRTWRTDLNLTAKGSNSLPGHSRGHSSWCDGWIISETAFALVLLVGTGLMVRSAVRLSRFDPGFNLQHLLVSYIDPGWKLIESTNESANRIEWRRRMDYFDQLTARLQSLPDVRGAGLIGDGGWMQAAPAPGVPEEPIYVYGCTTNWFSVMGIPLVQGRTFQSFQPNEVVVNETFVRHFGGHFFKKEHPIGQSFKLPDYGMPVTIVGVVKDFQLGPRQRRIAQIFGYYYEAPMGLYVRAGPGFFRATEVLSRELASYDSSLRDASVRGVVDEFRDWSAPQRFLSWLLGSFAVVAMVLAAVGIYGVVGSRVALRTREIGVRMALGAGWADVMALVLRQGMRPVLLGLGLGLSSSLILTLGMQHQLFDLAPYDPVTLAWGCAILGLVAFLACLLPAWRATRVDPLNALRHE